MSRQSRSLISNLKPASGGWPAAVAGVLALVLYAVTLAPGLTWAHNGADGGDLLAAALTAGVPHPSGYPTYQLLLRGVLALFPGEPARAGNWLSALCAAAAVALLADLARRASLPPALKIPPGGWKPRPPSRPRRLHAGLSRPSSAGSVGAGRLRNGCRDLGRRAFSFSSAVPWGSLVAVSAALAWAASPTLWGQAVITEVYTLHALVVVTLLWLLWRWREARGSGQPDYKWLVAAGLTFGLGLGNHLSLALMLPGMAVWLWESLARRPAPLSSETLSRARPLEGAWHVRGAIFRADAHAAAGATADENGRADAIRPYRMGASRGGRRPPWHVGGAIFRTGSSRRGNEGWVVSVLILLATAALGLSVYAYLPLAAASNPPINWGDPDTLPRLWAVVSGKIYRGLLFGVEWRWLPGRLAAWVADALRQFGPWGALIALAGLWRIDRTDHAWWRLTGLTALLYSIYAIGYNTADSYVYLIPTWAVAALWLAKGLGWGLRVAGCRLQVASRRSQVASRRSQVASRKSLVAIRALLLAALIALPAISVARFWGEMDLRGDRDAQEFIESALAAAAPDGVILTASDEPTFALWYAVYGLERRPDLIPLNVNLYPYPWYQETLAKRHPFLVEATGDPELPLLDQLVAAVALRRPLYRAEPLNVVLTGYSEQAAGVLVQMIGGPEAWKPLLPGKCSIGDDKVTR